MYLSRPKGQIVLDSFYLDKKSKLDKRGLIFSGIIFIPRYFIYLRSCGTTGIAQDSSSSFDTSYRLFLSNIFPIHIYNEALRLSKNN
jgi:hypothetical protein